MQFLPRRLLLAPLATALILAAACSGGDTSSPTDPEPELPVPLDPPPFRLARFPDGALPPLLLSGRSMEATMADLDGDGDLDVLVAREFEAAVLLLNDGQGRLTLASNRMPQAVRDYEDAAIADVDGDGDLDIVLVAEDDIPGGQGLTKHQLYLNNGTATFVDASDRIPVATEANAVVAGDIDADGDIDLILGNNGPETVLLNDGTGRFVVATSAITDNRSDVTMDVLLADVDRDGDLDLVIANEFGGDNRLMLNNGSGQFAPSPTPLLLRGSEVTRNASLGDIDGDGDLDLIFANVGFLGGDPRARLLRNDGGGTFVDVTTAALPLTVSGLFDLEFADLDGDGDLDLVGASFPLATLRILTNDGTGRFTDVSAPVLVTPVNVDGIEVEIGDLDGDGRRDIYVATFIQSGDVLLRNQP